jgi:hypothetical protein
MYLLSRLSINNKASYFSPQHLPTLTSSPRVMNPLRRFTCPSPLSPCSYPPYSASFKTPTPSISSSKVRAPLHFEWYHHNPNLNPLIILITGVRFASRQNRNTLTRRTFFPPSLKIRPVEHLAHHTSVSLNRSTPFAPCVRRTAHCTAL